MGSKKYGLTFPQSNIYLVEKFSDNTSINTIAGLFNINDKFDERICNKIVNMLIEKNDALRIKISEEDNSAYQCVEDYIYENIEYIDMSGMSEERVKQYLNTVVNMPFKLLDSKLYEFKIIKYNQNQGCILVKLHHIISDAWTLGQVANQLIIMYNDELNDIHNEFGTQTYIDFIQSEKEYVSSEKYIKDEGFWKGYFKDIQDPVPLKSYNKKLSTKANRYSVKLEKEFNDKINEYTKVNKVSPYTLFLAAISTYVYRTLDINDFIVGTPVLNRSNFKEKQMMGMFVSTMPTRIKIEESIKFIDLVKQIGSDTMSLFRHQKYPITKIFENIRKETNIEGKIYNLMFSFQNVRSNISENKIYSSDWLFSGHIQDELDIHILDMDNSGILNINYDYLVDLFEEEEIKYIHSRLIIIINNALNDINIDVDNIQIISELEYNKLKEYNNTDSLYPKDKTIIDLFEEQLKLNPNNTALISNEKKLTYKELNERSNGIANHLSNIRNENIILNITNSIDTIIAIYGILKSGNTYIPIDVSMPKDRLEYIIKDSNAKFIISKNKYRDITNINIDQIGSHKKNINNSDSNYIAYIIYTSGTTGNPKGVKILNRSLTNYIYWGSKVYKNKDNKIIMPLFTSIGFDLTVTTVFLPLITGGTIIITNKNIIDIFNILEINTIKLTPAHFTLVNYNVKKYDNIKTLILGGEALKTNICLNYTKYNDISIFNEYGPTETTVGCMIYKYDKSIDLDETVKIGKPADNVQLHVLNKKRKYVPIGCEGELYISGDGVSVGYLNLEERNKEAFKDNMYKTGDIVKLDLDMNMKYIGRQDKQVKINGYRIELDDISNIISKNFDTKDIVVTIKQINKINNICVYYVADKYYTEKEFHSILHTKLPIYMIPNLYFKVSKIPLNLNGKIDFKELDKMSVNKETKDKTDSSPRNSLEVIMCKILSELLNTTEVYPTSNIFKLGIDSLNIIKCQIRLANFNYTVDIQKFYEYPVIRDFCLNIIKGDNKKYDNSIKDLDKYREISFAKKSNKTKVENVMLTGATGYLGTHILKELLENRNIKKVICIVRGKDFIEKLNRKVGFYFDDIKLNDQSKLEIINGDLELEYFGVNKELFKNVDIIINAAAIVKHNGLRKQFEKTNVETVQNMIKVCIENDIILEHVSTMSVAGINAYDTLTENKFYIGQEYNINPYIETKFKAELLIYENINYNNLKANVYRMGNLTWRLSDHKFQYNEEENAFFMRLKNICKLKMYSDGVEKYNLEFTPVDVAARNILDLILNSKQEVNLIYHLYNDKIVGFNTFVNILKEKNIILKKVTDQEFVKEVKSYVEKDNILLSEIINYFNSIQVNVSNKKTNLKLQEGWPKLDRDYIEYILKNVNNKKEEI